LFSSVKPTKQGLTAGSAGIYPINSRKKKSDNLVYPILLKVLKKIAISRLYSISEIEKHWLTSYSRLLDYSCFEEICEELTTTDKIQQPDEKRTGF